MGSPIRVLVVDDHEVVLVGLRMILERDGLEVVGEARSGKQAVELIRKTQPDVVVLDVLMPDMGGLETLREIQALRRAPRVIVNTAHSKPENLREAIKLGAAGYVSKDESPASIVAAVRSVAEGSIAVSRNVLLEAFRDAVAEGPENFGQLEGLGFDLTPRQLMVAGLIGQGLDNAEIAEELSISPNTVKSHLREVYLKLGVSDRTKVALWAMNRGLVE